MFSTGQRAHCLCLNGQRKPKHILQFSNEDKDEKVTHTNFFSVKFDTGRIVGIIQMSSNDEMIFFIWKSRGYLIASLHVRGHTFRLSKSNWVLGYRKGLDLFKVFIVYIQEVLKIQTGNKHYVRSCPLRLSVQNMGDFFKVAFAPIIELFTFSFCPPLLRN